MAILISGKIEFKTKETKERQLRMIKATIYRKDIMIKNMNAPKNRVPKYMKQKLTQLKREMHSSSVAEDFNNPLLQLNKYNN